MFGKLIGKINIMLLNIMSETLWPNPNTICKLRRSVFFVTT
jgi:hypothetical protein